MNAAPGRHRAVAIKPPVSIFVFTLLGNLINAFTGTEPRAIFGVPITATILWYLSTQAVRNYFSSTADRITHNP